MHTPVHQRLSLAFTSATLLASLLMSGCASDEGPRHSARENAHPFPALVGEERFFSGKIIAELKVGAMTGFAPGSREKPDEGAATGGRRHGGHGQGGFGMGGGERAHRDGGFGGDGPDARDPAQTGIQTARRADRMGAPPVMIHLRFTNPGTNPVQLVIADFLSPLGNFVTNPEKLDLAAGQSAEVEPMTSRLAGEITGGEITLRLKSGTEEETRTITLRPEPTPSPAAPPKPVAASSLKAGCGTRPPPTARPPSGSV